MSGTLPGPRQRRLVGCTVDVTIGGERGVLSTGHAPDGTLAWVDFRAGVHGSALAGLADALATAITLGLQHGAPPAAYADALRHLPLDRLADGDDLVGRVLLDVFTGNSANR